jgi:hypothetical protein
VSEHKAISRAENECYCFVLEGLSPPPPFSDIFIIQMRINVSESIMKSVISSAESLNDNESYNMKAKKAIRNKETNFIYCHARQQRGRSFHFCH